MTVTPTTFEFKITSTTPLLMHGNRLCNPLDPMTKQMKRLNSKKNKTDEILLERMELEFMAGAYYDDGGMGLYIPGDNIKKAMVEAGRGDKRGIKANKSLWAEDAKLSYDGPQTLSGLWADERFRDVRIVTVGRAKLPRCRLKLPKWSATARVTLVGNDLNPEEVPELMQIAGGVIGVGDYRPRFGRFDVKL